MVVDASSAWWEVTFLKPHSESEITKRLNVLGQFLRHLDGPGERGFVSTRALGDHLACDTYGSSIVV